MSKRDSKFPFLTVLLVLCALWPHAAMAQRELAGAAGIKTALDKLSVCGTVLMIAAHPDDENTAVLAYFARGRKIDTGYLSLTRGEGGQNFIGPEQGERLGIIRTQELLAARRIDGARQFFTRAIDFGFTKTTDETFQKWGRDRILADVVWTIRKWRPDVVILRFSGTPRDGHGQHQASAILGKEAFAAAADPNRFPEQLKYVQPWQAKRLVWNVFSFSREQEQEAQKLTNRVSINVGDYDPVLGFSFQEIAGMSRSMHRSQAMGVAERKGARAEYFTTIGGDVATTDLFDGIDTTCRRIPGGDALTPLFDEASRSFDPAHPEKSLPPLLKARAILQNMTGLYAERKLEELQEAIALCAGVWVDAVAERANATPGSTLPITFTALRRLSVPVTVKQMGLQTGPAPLKEPALEMNKPLTSTLQWNVPADRPFTQPYWLEQPRDGDVYRVGSQQLIGMPENPPLLPALFQLSVDGADIELVRPVVYRFIDHALGERTRPVAVAPPVAISMPESAVVFGAAQPKTIEVGVQAQTPGQSGKVRIVAPEGWRVSPTSAEFSLKEAAEQATLAFEVTPPAKPCTAELKAVATAGGREIESQVEVIDYPHIPAQSLFPRAVSNVARADIRTLARHVGYIMGAGDEVPQALRQIGVEVSLLSDDDLARADFSRFDAIITGVRAWNTRPRLRATVQRLYDYANAGGTVIVQYNVLEGGFIGGDSKLLDRVGPYPMEISRDRVTVEEAPVRFPHPDLFLLHTPNEITKNDFEGWIQERGLYFASKWDPRYESVLETHDPGDKPLEGGTLFARVGKGAYIFTAFSWFRELPAGVPGAYRVFANFISAGKVLHDAR